MGSEDEWALRRLAYAYAEAVDQGDGDALAALFTEDGAIESPRGVTAGREQLRALPADVQSRYQKTFHAVFNQVATISGDRAEAMTYGIARHLIDAPAGQSSCNEMTIRYEDRFVRADGAWLFERRRLHVDWTHVFQVVPG